MSTTPTRRNRRARLFGRQYHLCWNAGKQGFDVKLGDDHIGFGASHESALAIAGRHARQAALPNGATTSVRTVRPDGTVSAEVLRG